MPIELLRQITLWVMAAGALFFLDAPFRTWRQRWVTQSWRERFLLLTVELDLVVLWAAFKYYLKLEARLAPASLETGIALAGLVLAAAGAALAVWGKLRLGRWFSATFGIKDGHELVTDGPYGVTRHPIYTGILASVAGAAVAWNSLLTLVLAMLLAVPFFFHTAFEEAQLERYFGDAYRDYQRRVPRLVPFVRPGIRG